MPLSPSASSVTDSNSTAGTEDNGRRKQAPSKIDVGTHSAADSRGSARPKPSTMTAQQQTRPRRDNARETMPSSDAQACDDKQYDASYYHGSMEKSRFWMFIVLFALGLICAAITLLLNVAADDDSDDSRDAANEQANALLVEIATIAIDRSDALRTSLVAAATTILSVAKIGADDTPQDDTPYFTVPFYEGLVGGMVQSNHLRSIIFAPTITGETSNTASDWTGYSNANFDQWASQSAALLDLPYASDDVTIAPSIYDLASGDGTADVASWKPPHVPVWQMSPLLLPASSAGDAATNLPLINGNLQSYPSFKEAHDAAHASNQFMTSKSVPQPSANAGDAIYDALISSTSSASSDDGPYAFIVQPVLKRQVGVMQDASAMTSTDTVGTLVGVLLWKDIFQNMFHEDTVNGEVAIILSNTCDQDFIYRVSRDASVFVGTDQSSLGGAFSMDSQHAIQRPLLESTLSASAAAGICSYALKVYPSKDLLDSDDDSIEGWQISASILAALGGIAIIFLLCDIRAHRQRCDERKRYLERKQAAHASQDGDEKHSNTTHTDSGGAITSDGRVITANTTTDAASTDNESIAHQSTGTARRGNHAEMTPSMLEKKRKQQRSDDHERSPGFAFNRLSSEDTLDCSYHNIGEDAAMPAWVQSPRQTVPIDESEVSDTDFALPKFGDSKPVADLFPHTTVMFADISGFTAWSSVREPSQVFTLLETVYRGFDRYAQRWSVFKVETVGDCYVAVSGLPEPNKDHAIIMCQFARDCVTLFKHLVSRLEVLLGPDTGDLGIRVGLHSGPVTAGVLRGDKSRFQLFGDTVNTAARIETTGSRNRIHISHDTAGLLHADGKSDWVRKRTDTIIAKGKGELQTFWLLTDAELSQPCALPSDANGTALTAAPLPVVKAMQPRVAKSAAVNTEDAATALPPKLRRLVDWNVDVLKRLLQKIAAKRIARGDTGSMSNLEQSDLASLEGDILLNNYVLDEVQEIITLPKFDQKAKYEGNTNKIQLPEEVKDQLRLYVSSIAAMHRGNPFHNFEHASHVMMSVSKLLSRIIAPTEVKDQEESALHDHTYGITSDPLTQFAVVLAALVHDVDHSGVSNFQLIKEDSKIASVFKNKSVAEQNSIVLAWERLMEPRFLTLRRYIYTDPSDVVRFRALMVNTVLATDIFDQELQTLRKTRWEKAFHSSASMSGSESESDERNRKATIVIEHLIQASDVAHTMQHWHVYQKWNERLFQEMTVAYQSGRMSKDPAVGWYQGELGFFDNYIIPLTKKLKECGVFGVSSDEYLNYALENRREWAVKGEEIVTTMIKRYQIVE